MALPTSFLDQVRERVLLSGIIGRTLKLTKAGREFKACCPFHGEKTPSFTINDEKGFAHCFGCGWHGDVFRWMRDQMGVGFLDAVRELAQVAGMSMPAPTPAEAERGRRIDTVRGALDQAQAIYANQLHQAGAVMEYLAGRGIDPVDIERFGLGYARAGEGSLKGRGIGSKLAYLAGLVAQREDGSLREMFHDRITVPIHDARGALIGFGGRVWPGRRGDTPKFLNSPDSAIFDKGRILFNLHRAQAAARPQAENRLVVVEGYFDVVALTRIGLAACVAPMGTALTEEQLDRCWRVHNCPSLLFDGDAAGKKAALRAARMALPKVGPGRQIKIATLSDGKDPDDVAQGENGKTMIEMTLSAAKNCHDFLFDAAMQGDI